MISKFLGGAVVGFSLMSAPANAQALTQAKCKSLSDMHRAGFDQIDAEWLIIDGTEVCRVEGRRAPLLDIEVVLPKTWAERSFQVGGGGFDGRILSAIQSDDSGAPIALDPIVALYDSVYIASNGGNRADTPAEAAPGIWFGGADGAAGSIEDYAYRAVGSAQAFAASVIEVAYDAPAKHSYFMGCSNGGRNAYIAAERYGDVFDGIVAGCEPMDMSSMLANWMSIGRHAGTVAFPTDDQFVWAYDQAISACDSLDGAIDRIIARPDACDFAPKALSCTTIEDPLCLKDAQVATMTEMLAPLTSAQGDTISLGYNWTDFSEFGSGFGMLGSVYAAIGAGDPGWTALERQQGYQLDRDHYAMALGLDRQGFGHDMVAIAQYVANGGTLLSWHGSADNLISPKDHAATFTRMMDLAKRMATETGVDTSQRARFFSVPGATHGRGQHPATDFVPAIIAWVEGGTPPQQMTYIREDDGIDLPVCRADQSLAYAEGTYSCTTN